MFAKYPLHHLLLAGCLLLVSCLPLQAQLQWQRMPGPPGGFGPVLPGTGGKWLLQSSIIGIHESADKGETWRWNALPRPIHTEAAMHIGTDGNLWFFDREQVSRSEDNGRSWTEVRSDSSLWITNKLSASMVMDGGQTLLGVNGAGVLLSNDLGKNIETVFPTTVGLDALARHPASGHLYTWRKSAAANQINPVYRSTDGGLTWSTWQNDLLTTGRQINALAFAPNGTVFLVTNMWLLRSVDDGNTWVELPMRAAEITATATGRLLATNNEQFSVPRTLRSDDNGETWEAAPTDNMYAFSAMPDGIVFGVNNSGLYRSEDDGNTWQFSAFGAAHHLQGFQLHFYPDQSAIAMTNHGVFYSSNGATNWEHRLQQMIVAGNCAALPDGQLFCVDNVRLMRSTDKGLSWIDVAPAPLADQALLRSVDGVLFCQSDYNQMYRSADGGQSWQDLGTQQINPPRQGADGTFWAFDYGINLQKSTDRGLTWTKVNTPSLTSDARIMAHSSGILLLFGNNKVHRSTNNGASWTTFNQSGMKWVSTSFENTSGHLFVMGTEIGSTLLLSVDDGLTWRTVSRPNTYWASQALYIDPQQHLWIASGDGVWRTTWPSTDILTFGGSVRSDQNANCMASFPEPLLSGIIVKSTASNGDTRYSISNDDGQYRVLTRAGDFSVTSVAPNELWAPCTLAVNIPTTQTSGNVSGKNVALRPLANCPRLEVDIATPFLRRCFETKLAVTYKNTGTTNALNTRIELVPDPFLEVLSSSLPVSGQSGDTLFFDLGTLKANQKGTFYLDIKTSCSSELGQMHCTWARITPDTFCSGWQGAILYTDMTCLGDSVRLQIQNTGSVPMQAPQKWQLLRGNSPIPEQLFDGIVLLGPNESFIKTVPTDPQNAQLHLKIPQENGYPYGSGFAQSTLLHCNGGTEQPYSFPILSNQPGRAQLCLRNIGSFDPNDKTGFPEGVGAAHYIDPTEPLDYLIRFQNTGTDTAFTVVIRDTLSPLLDIESFKPGAASHPVVVSIRGENELVFTFENIMLPDSNINEPASNGFIRYAIRQKRDNPCGSIIRNRASIYFDFNHPIVTNETWHTVCLPITSATTTSGRQNPVSSLHVAPNPSKGSFRVYLDEVNIDLTIEEARQELLLEITDITGRILRKQPYHHPETYVERTALPSGTLLLLIRHPNGLVVARNKIILLDR